MSLYALNLLTTEEDKPSSHHGQHMPEKAATLENNEYI